MATEEPPPQDAANFIYNAARLVLGIAAAWFALIALQGFAAARNFGPAWLQFDYELSARFGDSFGPLTAVMAAIAAIAAVATYRSQSAELRETRLRESATQASADRRDFENTFFRLLELLRETVNETCVHHPQMNKEFQGRQAFRVILAQAKSSGDDEADRATWKMAYLRYQPQLGHYFRLIYQILRFIDDSQIANKKLYARILRATLDNPEIVLLGLNGWHGGYPKTKKLVTKYAMLHNITASTAVDRRLHLGYKRLAFGKRDILAENKYDSENRE